VEEEMGRQGRREGKKVIKILPITIFIETT